MINVGDTNTFVSEWPGKNREWSKIITKYYTKRRHRTDFTTPIHFPRIHRSVPRKIGLLYF